MLNSVERSEKCQDKYNMEKIKNFTEFTEISEKKTPVYEYGCMMIYFDFPEMNNLHSKIEKEDLYTGEEGETSRYGLENEPHVTLLYGLHSDKLSDEEVMKSVDKSQVKNLKLHNMSSFDNEKYDVLKFDVKGEGLKENNENLKQFPYTNDYPKYHPHCTVAYLKPGKAAKYKKMFEGEEFDVSAKELVYSKPGEESDKQKIREKFNGNS